MKTEILYIDMDNVLVDFPSAFNKLNEETLKKYEGRLDEVPGIFSLMEPLEGAVEAFEVLATLFDTYILSTAPWGNPSTWSDKLLSKISENSLNKPVFFSNATITQKTRNKANLVLFVRIGMSFKKAII